MANEKTKLLQDNGVHDNTKCYVTVPKQRLLGDENNNHIPLTYAELMPYVDDPWWQHLRKVIMLLFWTTLLVMFLSACIISITESQSKLCMANRNFNGSVVVMPIAQSVDSITNNNTLSQSSVY